MGNHDGTSRQRDWLVHMGVCWGDRGHKTDSPFHKISKAPRVIHISAVVVVSIDKRVNDSHYDDSKLMSS